jgi:hypothetical protein
MKKYYGEKSMTDQKEEDGSVQAQNGLKSGEFVVVSINPRTGETSVDDYDDKDKALSMAKQFRDDMPDRQFYLGSKLERLLEGMEDA